MPAPSTREEFLGLAKKCEAVDSKRLSAFLAQAAAKGTLPPEVRKLAALMVREGVLTIFQAEQLLQGKWRNFTIGKYKVLERLGSGAVSNVFLCEHQFMRNRVAVKVLFTTKADNPGILQRFYREARAAAALDHPNIVHAYDIDHEDNLHFLVMEYVEGTNLGKIVSKYGPMDTLRAVHYIRQAAQGLQHAHENGLIHRDIKPANILVDRHGVVRILDMGLARFFEDETNVLTQKENVLGTADYLAPEQAVDSHRVDIRADIYSLGATFYHILTGRPPFDEGSLARKLIMLQTKEPTPIRKLRPSIPAEIQAIVEKMMAKDREKRYQTPAEVVEALEPWTQEAIAPPPEEEMPYLSAAAQLADYATRPLPRGAVMMASQYTAAAETQPEIQIAETPPISEPPPITPPKTPLPRRPKLQAKPQDTGSSFPGESRLTPSGNPAAETDSSMATMPNYPRPRIGNSLGWWVVVVVLATMVAGLGYLIVRTLLANSL